MKEKKPHVCLVTNLLHRVTNATSNGNSGHETLKPMPHVKVTTLKSSQWNNAKAEPGMARGPAESKRQLTPCLCSERRPAGRPGVGTGTLPRHRCQQGEAVPT